MFDSDLCQKYVEELIRFDEVERALLVLENVPAFERDNPPPNLAFLKKQILGAICTVNAYTEDCLDQEVDLTAGKIIKEQLRGILVKEEVERYNRLGLTPHIVDMGPGEYGIPIGLKEQGYKFTYKPISCDIKARCRANDLLCDVMTEAKGPQIFLGLEIIEHLHQPTDLVTEALRNCGGYPERIHLSTPCYTFDIGPKNWRKKSGLPHLRAYTPREFTSKANELFPGYTWQLYQGNILSLRGLRHDCVDDTPLIGKAT